MAISSSGVVSPGNSVNLAQDFSESIETSKSSTPHSSSRQKSVFFWRPFLGIFLAIILFIFLSRLHGDLLLYSMHQFGQNVFTFQIFSLQLISVIWVLFLGLIVDFIGARAGIISFFIFSLGFSVLACTKISISSSQFALEIFSLAEILLVLVIFKTSAIYYKNLKFFIFLAIVYTFITVLMHFERPVFMPGLPMPNLQKFGILLAILSIALGSLCYFLWPSDEDEKRQYDLLKFREILSPICRLKGWAVMVSLGVLFFYLILFFKLAVLYYFPAVLDIDDGYQEAVFLFGFGCIVGCFVYSFIFKNTPYLGRVIGASLALAIFCLLGIGFLSMSEELIWCLVALVGVFLGSIVLLFRLLLDASGVAGFATACSVSILLAAAVYAFPGLTAFQGFHDLSIQEIAKHHLYLHLWWSGIFLLVIPMILMFLVPNVRLSFPITTGSRVKLSNTLKGYWRGEFTLSSAFWLLSVLGRWIGIFILFWLIFAFWFPSNLEEVFGKKVIGSMLSPMDIDWYHLSVFGLFLSIFGIIIGLFLVVSVWRCGRRSLWIWRYLSRVIVILSLIRNLLLLFGVSMGIYLHFHPEIMAKYLTKSPAQTSQADQVSLKEGKI